MAVVSSNLLIGHFSGAIGNVVFRKVGNKTIVSQKSIPGKKQSELQRVNRQKFRDASAYAKEVLLDPQKKAYYQQKAKKLALPNAYTAAIMDYMRKGVVSEINTSAYNGKAGSKIRITASKKHFAVNKVKVVLKDHQGFILHSGEAIKKGVDWFEYIMPHDIAPHTAHIVAVTIADFGRTHSVLEKVIQV